jgi:hypothetical protein
VQGGEYVWWGELFNIRRDLLEVMDGTECWTNMRSQIK